MTTRRFSALAVFFFGVVAPAQNHGDEIVLRQPRSIAPWAPQRESLDRELESFDKAQPIPSPSRDQEPAWLQPTTERPFFRRQAAGAQRNQVLPMVETESHAMLGDIPADPAAPRIGPIRRMRDSIQEARQSFPLRFLRSAASETDRSTQLR